MTPESGGHGTMRGEGYSHHSLCLLLLFSILAILPTLLFKTISYATMIELPQMMRISPEKEVKES